MGRHAPIRDGMGYHGISWSSTGLPSKIAEFCRICKVEAGQKGTVTLRTKVKHPDRPMKNRDAPAASRRCGVNELKKGQMACKPGSVSRPKAVDGHSSGTSVTGRLLQPTRAAARKRACPRRTRHPYSVLLPVGFALPRPLPAARCALTAPFHPCLPERTGGLLSVALSLGSPPPDVIRHRVSVEPGLSSALRQQPSGHLTQKKDIGRGTSPRQAN